MFATQLRERSIRLDRGKVLIAKLQNSSQEADLTLPPNCNGYGRIRHFRLETAKGWPLNPLPIIPACRALGISPIPELMKAQVFQNAACAWRCWYCFVPKNLLSADPNHAEWFSSSELVELYSQVTNPPRIIDLSGGSPDLIPEWTLWMMTALKKANIDHNTYLWTDDNLSTTYLLDKLSPSDHDTMRNYPNYGRVCCIKGFDKTSFAFNTRAQPEGYHNQFKILRSVLALGIDTYGYVTLTSPCADRVTRKVANLIDRLQEIDADLPLRFVPLRVEIFTPVKPLLSRNPTLENSLDVQEEAIAVWNSEIERRFNVQSRARSICDVKLNSYSD